MRQHKAEMGLPGGSDSKESACNAGDMDSIPGWGRSSGGGNGNPLHYFCLENPHGQRSLVGYSPQGRKESYVTVHARTLLEVLTHFSKFFLKINLFLLCMGFF